jgi:hypothetical protein
MRHTIFGIGLAILLIVTIASAGWLFYFCYSWLTQPKQLKVGDSCTPSRLKFPSNVDILDCLDSTTVLACSPAGKVVQFPCRGPDGCRRVDRSSSLNHKGGIIISCDTSVVEQGDPCWISELERQRYANCGVNHRSMLSCVSGQWQVTAECLGKNGCITSGNTVKCDESVGRPGGKCSGQPWRRLNEKVWHQPYACSEDGLSMLVCNKGVFKKVSDCGGSGCSVGDENITCDKTTSSMVGVECEPEGASTCADDKRTLLICRSGQFVVNRKCGQHERCEVRGDYVGCYRSP